MNPKPRYLSVLSDKGLAVESRIIAFINSLPVVTKNKTEQLYNMRAAVHIGISCRAAVQLSLHAMLPLLLSVSQAQTGGVQGHFRPDSPLYKEFWLHSGCAVM